MIKLVRRPGRANSAVNIRHRLRHNLSTSLCERAKMVYYFTSNTVTPAAFIYVGKDKVESTYFVYSLMSCTNFP